MIDYISGPYIKIYSLSNIKYLSGYIFLLKKTSQEKAATLVPITAMLKRHNEPYPLARINAPARLGPMVAPPPMAVVMRGTKRPDLSALEMAPSWKGSAKFQPLWIKNAAMV